MITPIVAVSPITRREIISPRTKLPLQIIPLGTADREAFRKICTFLGTYLPLQEIRDAATRFSDERRGCENVMACLEGERIVAGMIAGEGEPSVARIDYLWVFPHTGEDPGYRDIGVGNALLNIAERKFREAGLRFIETISYDEPRSSCDSRKWISKRGYSDRGGIKYYGLAGRRHVKKL